MPTTNSGNSVYDFEECKTLFTEAAAQFSNRKTIFDNQEKMFFLKDDDLPTAAHIRKVIAPDPRNYVLGATRLMTATRARWEVPRLLNADALSDIASNIERACDAILTISGQITNRPVEVEAALSAFLYGEVQLKIINTKAMMENLKGAKLERAKYINSRTPLLLQVVNPKIGYPIYDIDGLSIYASEENVMVNYLRSRFGEDKLPGKKLTEKVVFYELWSDTTHACWAAGETEPFVLDENKLGYIPIVSEIVEGSDFFVEETQPSRQPLMFTYAESGLWKAQNMALTIMSSLALSVAATPMMKFEMAQMGDEVEVETDAIPWGVVKIPPGAKFDSLIKQIIDPSIIKINELAEQKGMESSIYRQALGEPLGNNAPFSMVSLLSSAGRLPLVPYQRCINHVLGKAMFTGLQMCKAGGVSKTKISGAEGVVEIDFKTLPDNFVLEANLQISVPQDERENVAIAVQATSGDNPLVSLEYARKQWLNIGQSDVMQKDIWKEKRLSLMNQLDLQAQAEQAKQNALNAKTNPNSGTPPEINNPSMTPQSQNGVPGMAATSPQPIGTLGKNETGVV